MKISSLNTLSYRLPLTSFSQQKQESFLVPKKDFLNSTIDAKTQQTSDVNALRVLQSKKRTTNSFQKFLTQKGKVSISEYKEIKRKHPSVIVRAYEYVDKYSYCVSKSRDIALLAINIKNYFDNAPYIAGEKYRIISVGTSPAPITEALKNLGCDVVFLPISGIRFESSELKNSKNMQIALEYLKRNGVSADDSENKINILLDFVASGHSLFNVEHLIQNVNNVDLFRIWTLSLTKLVSDVLFEEGEAVPIKVDQDNKMMVYLNLKSDMGSSRTENISNVPHFYIEDDENKKEKFSISSEDKTKEEIFQEFDDFSRPLGRAFSLCVINEMMNSMDFSKLLR